MSKQSKAEDGVESGFGGAGAAAGGRAREGSGAGGGALSLDGERRAGAGYADDLAQGHSRWRGPRGPWC